MKKLLYILLLFPLLLQAQYELKPDVKPMFRVVYEPLAAFDSTDLERYLVINTFLLDNGVVAALVDTITTDTLRVYITGSDQPTPVTSMSSVQLDSSIQIGLTGVQFDSIPLILGEVFWYSGGRGFNIGKAIYTTPGAPSTLTISSPDSDTLTYAVNDFPILANNTDADSSMVRWDTVAIPTTITAGNLVYRGDTNVAETDFFIDMADSLKVYVSAFAKNDTGTAIGAWSIARTDSVFIDSTGAGYAYQSEFYSDTILARWSNDPTPGSEQDQIFDSLFWQLDTITDGGAELSVLRKADLQYVMASHNTDDSRINTAIQGGLAGNFPLTVGVAGMAFTQFQGWEGNGTGYFTTGWDPTNESSQYSQDDAGIAVMTNQDDAAGSVREVGADDGSNDAFAMVQWTGGNTGGQINTANFSEFNQAVGDIFLVVQRTGAFNFQEVWIDGGNVLQHGKSSSGMPDNDFYVLAVNNGSDVGANISSNQISYVWVGIQLTATQIANWDVIMDWFKSRMGY